MIMINSTIMSTASSIEDRQALPANEEELRKMARENDTPNKEFDESLRLFVRGEIIAAVKRLFRKSEE
ncbi:hypothetical protein HN801_03030 [Candidatus Peregrinibacteria bacterium]|nr:hypothetical protein [Candidatus Peregrinibacteria bacterium]